MSRLIDNGQVVLAEWKVLNLAANETAQDVKLPVGPLLVPLSVWQARRRELVHREYEHGWALGIWLAAGDDLQAIENDLDDFSVIVLEPGDGNSQLVPRLLRDRHDYRGELYLIDGAPEHSGGLRRPRINAAAVLQAA
jgi:uncharacterized protein (DUF934 family)